MVLDSGKIDELDRFGFRCLKETCLSLATALLLPAIEVKSIMPFGEH